MNIYGKFFEKLQQHKCCGAVILRLILLVIKLCLYQRLRLPDLSFVLCHLGTIFRYFKHLFDVFLRR